MNPTITALFSFLLAGLAGSLHCVGMCGPILAGFSVAFRAQPVTLTIDPAIKPRQTRFPIALDMIAYHTGRIWTYAFLGLLAGLLGDSLRHGSQSLGFQRATSSMLAIAVIVSGVVLLGIIPRFTRTKAGVGDPSTPTSPPHTSAPRRLLDTLKHGRGAAPKLLLGAIMGFLPCGLVYAMLALAAALPNPLLSALGMILFGVGTLPSLTAVLLTANLLPARIRAHGSQVAAALLIVTGSWMLTRALTVTPESCCDEHEPPPAVAMDQPGP